MFSVQDVLENEQVKLDNMFKFSLMQDIVRVSYVPRSRYTLFHFHCLVFDKQLRRRTRYQQGISSIYRRFLTAVLMLIT